MRIACPNCDAAYDVPPDRVTPGRNVRCARCATKWAPVQPPPSPDPQRPPDPAPTPSPEIVAPFRPIEKTPSVAAASLDPAPAEPSPRGAAGSEPSSRSASRLPLLAAWLVSLGLLAGLGWAAVTYRDGVIRTWPPSERAYRALGLGQRPPAPPAPAPAH